MHGDDFDERETVRKRVALPVELLEWIGEMYPEATSVSEAIRLAAADGVRARKKYQGYFECKCDGEG